LISENVQGAKLVLLADDTNLLITGKDEFELLHKIICHERAASINMVSKK
jgi:hypothetical protein